MHLTVAVCTYNRSASLRRTLESFTRLAAPTGFTWELIVVNNGSHDDTAAVIASFRLALPIVPVDEYKVGKSHGANAAVAIASGEYIVWTDDDVLVDPQWLSGYHDTFRQWPGDAFFGGPVIPVFEGSRPPWLSGALRHFGNVYAAVDYGEQPVTLEADRLPYGANMATRTAAQRQHPYDPRLGRRGYQLFAGEEWGVFSSMMASGLTGRWVPRARVQHVIPPERQTLRYVRAYYVGNGASWAAVQVPTGVSTAFGRPRWVWREAILGEARYRLRRLYAPSEVWSEDLKRASTAWGMLRLGGSP